MAGQPVCAAVREYTAPSAELMRSIHLTMVRIRRFEERAVELFMAQELPGFLHSCLGQEAVPAGACAALEEGDYITSTHRGHGHVIAKGLRLDRMMAELYGRTTGYCKGKGGSMHIADFSRGILGANGIVGGGIPIAVGAALSAKMRKSGQVAAAFFGDGAASQGSFHEAANMAAVWRLPAVFVCENNLYAVSTHESRQRVVPDVAARAASYGMPGVTVDGNNPLAVYQAMAEAVARARAGEGPSLVECRTYKWLGHYVGDPGKYRPAEEVAAWKAADPLPRYERELAARGVLSAEDAAHVHGEVAREIEQAVEFARRSPHPSPEDALKDVEA
jgi:acetoin:2,6-dichlorophenolindophenol oxidoreductase subunit alpha